MLCSAFDAYASQAKSIKEYRVAADNFANVQAVPEDDTEQALIFSEEDLKQIEIGLAAIPRKLSVWLGCRDLIAQLENKKEYDINRNV